MSQGMGALKMGGGGGGLGNPLRTMLCWIGFHSGTKIYPV